MQEQTELCSEIRDCLINTVSKNGGHLASNLGSVELTVAIHSVFDAPTDTVVFDVGHQCYTHKLLTGRYEQFDTLRKFGGLSGFLRPDESEYDAIVTGHSSSSVSAAYGIMKGEQLLGKQNFTVAVVGDGAMTGGMVSEAFNNIGREKKNLIIILNDNNMSISKNVGALSRHFTQMRISKSYVEFKSGFSDFLLKIPAVGPFFKKIFLHLKTALKNALYHSNIFEVFGFHYMGPIDGHNLEQLQKALSLAKRRNKPVIIHVKTVKGKGYGPAEATPDLFHGVSSFNVETGAVAPHKKDYSDVFGETLCEIAATDTKVCAITAAMSSGTGLENFSKLYKDRFFDVGIAEQHAVTFCAGLAKAGMKPVFAVYSTFLQRGYDQIMHDVAIANLPVTFCVDRAGIVGADGETHQGVFDVNFLLTIPNVKIFSPTSFDELRGVLKKRLENPQGVAVIRYPRGVQNEKIEYNDGDFTTFENGGKSVIVTYGKLFYETKAAQEMLNAEKITADVFKLNKIWPISEQVIEKLSSYEKVYVYEEAYSVGSIGQYIAAQLAQVGFKGKLKITAINGFVKQGTVDELLKENLLNTQAIFDAVRKDDSLESK